MVFQAERQRDSAIESATRPSDAMNDEVDGTQYRRHGGAGESQKGRQCKGSMDCEQGDHIALFGSGWRRRVEKSALVEAR